MRSLLSGAATAALVLSLGGAAQALEAGDLPPDAVPGHCYAKVQVPERFETYTEQAVVNPARTEQRVIPAVTAQVDQQVVDTPAYTRTETVPATYRTVTETVMVRPATTRRVETAAVYGWESQEVLVSPAHTEWRRSTPGPQAVLIPGGYRVTPTGEVVCLVQVPAEYRTVTRQVVKVPAGVREVPVPAEYAAQTRQVIDQPAHTIEHPVAATYRTVRVTTVVQPERTETVEIPATYATVTKQRLVSPARTEWREITCRPERPEPRAVRPAVPHPAPRHVREAARPAAHRAPAAYVHGPCCQGPSGPPTGDTMVRAMQLALQDRGLYKGPVDGLLSPSTQDAMVRFQTDSHLEPGRLTPETARALGITR